MSHWRTGVCAPAIWLNREQCCWGSRDVEFDPVHNEICEHVSILIDSFDLVVFKRSVLFSFYLILVEKLVRCTRNEFHYS